MKFLSNNINYNNNHFQGYLKLRGETFRLAKHFIKIKIIVKDFFIWIFISIVFLCKD